MKGNGLSLADIDDCLQGMFPTAIATASADGTPNVTYISQVYLVDERHVALSFQFLNKTAENLKANPNITALLTRPATCDQVEMQLRQVGMQSDGPVFDSMYKQLTNIAEQTGMSGCFRLRGAIICEVLDIKILPGDGCADQQPGGVALTDFATFSDRLTATETTEELVDAVLDGLTEELGYEHAIFFFYEEPTDSLVAIGSRGYEASGVGAEVVLGQGAVGRAARDRELVQVGSLVRDQVYSRAVRLRVIADGGVGFAAEVPLPGLKNCGGQIAVPIVLRQRLIGALLVETEIVTRFGKADPPLLQLVANQIAPRMALQERSGPPDSSRTEVHRPDLDSAPTVFRFFAEDQSVFIGDDYLVRGVAGSVLRVLLKTWVGEGRTDWSNREIRVHPLVPLPAHNDNLEARLHLLRTRLAERNSPIQIDKNGRGRFCVVVRSPVKLVEV